MTTASGYPLEPDRTATIAMGKAVVERLADFIEGLDKAPASQAGDADALVPDLLRGPPDAPHELSGLIEQFSAAASVSVDTAGPRYLGYIPGGGLLSAALADLLAQGFNRHSGFAALAPGLVAMEESILRWLCQEFGLPSAAGGLTTTGGSIANLTAIVAARHDRLGEEFDNGTLYVTAATHRSVAKAARVAGIRPSRIRTVPTTADLRMDLDAAAAMIGSDRAAGFRPFLLVGTAGTTDTGAVDPLAAAADLAHREGMWFHVDAAYGGFFQLTQRGRARFAGISAADSITLDPHKGLFLPYGTGILLVNDRRRLRAAFAADGSYLQDVTADDSLPDYADLGPELSRGYRGLRLWLPFHLHGVTAFRQALDEKLDLASDAYDALSSDPNLDVPWQPELSTVAFALNDDGADGARTKELLERINATRRVFLSSTRIDGRYLIRLCVLSHRTHADSVSEAVEVIRATSTHGSDHR
jgi:aromatic-L-amino-acid decarboxylase